MTKSIGIYWNVHCRGNCEVKLRLSFLGVLIWNKRWGRSRRYLLHRCSLFPHQRNNFHIKNTQIWLVLFRLFWVFLLSFKVYFSNNFWYYFILNFQYNFLSFDFYSKKLSTYLLGCFLKILILSAHWQEASVLEKVLR